MKVLFIISNTRMGGAENFTLRLVDGLKKKMPEAEFHCLVTHQTGDLHDKYVAAFSKIDTLWQAETSKQKVPRIQQCITENGYDLIHSIDNFDTVPYLLGTPPIVQNIFFDATLPEHEAFIAPTKAHLGVFSAFVTEAPHNLSVLPKMHHIPNGVDVNFWVPGDEPRSGACWVGRLTPRKGGLLLEQLIRNNPKIKFTVVANEPNTSPGFMHQQFLELGKECSNLTYKWTLSPEAVREVYQSAKVYLHTSLSEAQPGTLLEAMACGCVPVCTDAGGVPDVLGEDFTAVALDSSDVVTHLEATLKMQLNRKAQVIAKASAKARQRIVDSFSLSGVADKYITLYKEVMR